MNAPATVSPLPDSKVKPLHVLIMGKCLSTRKTPSGKSYSHIVRTPARTEFDYPQTVEFFAEKKLYDTDDTVVQVCVVHGKADSYIGKDADGEPKKIQTARMSLWAAE